MWYNDSKNKHENDSIYFYLLTNHSTMTETQPTREEMIERIGDVIGNYSVIYSDIIDYIAIKDADLLEHSKECIEMWVCSLWTKKENTLKCQSDDCISYVFSLLPTTEWPTQTNLTPMV